MAYTPKPGDGSMFYNDFHDQNESAPKWKGSLILPDGTVIGVAAWSKTGNNGEFLSLKIDDKEGAFQAKRMQREQTKLGGGSRDEHERGSDRRDDRRGSRDDRGGGRGNSRDDRDDRGGSRHSRDDDRRRPERDDNRNGGSRHSSSRERGGFDPDLNDDPPFD